MPSMAVKEAVKLALEGAKQYRNFFLYIVWKGKER